MWRARWTHLEIWRGARLLVSPPVLVSLARDCLMFRRHSIRQLGAKVFERVQSEIEMAWQRLNDEKSNSKDLAPKLAPNGKPPPRSGLAGPAFNPRGSTFLFRRKSSLHWKQARRTYAHVYPVAEMAVPAKLYARRSNSFAR